MLRRPTIHVIDDDPLFLDEMRSLFQAQSYGEDMRTHSQIGDVDIQPGDIACLDLRLADGRRPSQTVQELTEAGASVIIVTTGASSAELQDCLRAGAVGVVLKPDVPDGLPSALATAFAGGVVLNRETCASLIGLSACLSENLRRLTELVAAGLSAEQAFPLSGLDVRHAARVQQDIRRELEQRVVGWPDKNLTIGVVDDHWLAVSGVKQVLHSGLDDRVNVAGAATVAELLSLPLEFDAVILDVLLADGSVPRDNVALLRSASAEVLLFTSLEPGDPSRDDDVNAAMEAGAKALIFKGDADRELLDALKDVLAGAMYFNLAWSRALSRVRSDMSLLTPREKEVFLKHRAGLSQQEIADLFCLSRETVKSHFKSINAKLNGRP